MSFTASLQPSWQKSLAASCDRLVHPSVQREAQRGRHARLIGQLLAAPFLLAPLLGQTWFALNLAQQIPALVCVVIALCWSGAVAVATSARARAVEGAGLALLAAMLVSVVGAGGIWQTPFVLLLAALPFEAWWNRGTGRAAAAGGAVGAGILLLAGGFAGILPDISLAAHHWAVPLAWAGTAWLRLAHRMRDRNPPLSCKEIAGLTGLLAMRTDRVGHVEEISGDTMGLFGVRTPVLLGSGLIDRMPPGDRLAYLDAIACALTKRERIELKLRLRKPGTMQEHALHGCSVVPANQGEALLLFLATQGERKTSEAADGADALAHPAEGGYLSKEPLEGMPQERAAEAETQHGEVVRIRPCRSGEENPAAGEGKRELERENEQKRRFA